MDSNNWRPNQGTEPAMDTSDWRAQLMPDSRQRIVNKIMDTLKKHLPVSGPEGLLELRKIAQRFEEKIFTAATSQSDYLRKISLKMLTMETKSQNTMANNMPSNQVGPSNKPPDQGLVLQPQVHNPGQQHSIPLPNQPQPRQQLQPQNSNIQNIFPGSQRQMPGRQQVVPQQQQQQSQNTQQYLYQQQLLKHKLHLQSQIRQQQQQNLLQPNQLQSSQQSVIQTSSVMPPSVMQTSSLSSLQQNQQSNNVQQSTQSMLQQHPQVIRHQQQQTSIVHQQQTPMTQQPMLPAQQQQQQQLMGLQSNATNMQHAQMLGPQNNVGDIQQPQRLLAQQNNLTNLQQRQQQQQLMNQQNNLANIHQQQFGNNTPGLQQQQLLGPESGNPGMQTSHHSAHMLQQPKVPMQQQSQKNASNFLPSQALQSQPQAAQQQLMPQIHTQPAQLQHHPYPLQRDMQQRLQASGSLLQPQNVLDQLKQLYQSQRALPETSTTSLDSTAQTAQPSGVDWQEEVYQKIQTMKESYLPELNEMYQKIATKLQQVNSMSPKTLSAAVSDIGSVVSMIDRIAGSAPGNGSRAAVGEDLVSMTNCRLQARNFITQDGTNGIKRMKRYTSAIPLNVVLSAGSMNDNIKHLTALEASDLESTATSNVKKAKIEANHALLEEIREINHQVIDTVVDISDEDVDPAATAEGAEGTVVKCSFSAVELQISLLISLILAAGVVMCLIALLRGVVKLSYA